MVKLKNKKTGKLYSLSDELYIKLKEQGKDNRYTVVTDSQEAKQPAEVRTSDRTALLRDSEKAFSEKQFDKALDLLETANAIRSSKKIQDRISEINDILSKDK